MSASASLADVLDRISTDPFEQSTVTALESYVIYELKEKSYDFEVNKALLRSYQVNADWIKLDFVVNVLVLALTRLPSTDFLSLSYFLHGKLSQEPKLKQLQTFYDLLERAEFANFWTEFKAADASVTSAAVGFTDAIRAFILGATRDTFRNISKELLSQFLGFSIAELDVYLQSSPLIEQVSGDTVTLVHGEGQTKKLDDGLRLDELLPPQSHWMPSQRQQQPGNIINQYRRK